MILAAALSTLSSYLIGDISCMLEGICEGDGKSSYSSEIDAKSAVCYSGSKVCWGFLSNLFGLNDPLMSSKTSPLGPSCDCSTEPLSSDLAAIMITAVFLSSSSSSSVIWLWILYPVTNSN